MNKIFAIIIIAVVIVGGYFLVKKDAPKSATPVLETSNNEVASQSSTNQISATKEKTITYTDDGYSPSPLEINIGDTVVFKNNSSQSMWRLRRCTPLIKIIRQSADA